MTMDTPLLLYILIISMIILLERKYPSRKKSATAFSKGDKVQAFGNTGTVKSISSNGMFLEVSFAEAETTVVFTIDGKIHNWNNVPSLVKI